MEFLPSTLSGETAMSSVIEKLPSGLESSSGRNERSAESVKLVNNVCEYNSYDWPIFLLAKG